MRFLGLFFIALMPITLWAQEDCDETTPKEVRTALKAAKMVSEANCPNEKKIQHICAYINDREPDKDPDSPYDYTYQRMVIEASCADMEKDSEALIAEKVSKMWSKFENKLICNSLRFDVHNGSIIKYAVASHFDQFIEDVAAWKVNLNKVDAHDKKTVLDYISDHLERSKNTPLEPDLKRYYQILRKAGAKHKREL